MKIMFLKSKKLTLFSQSREVTRKATGQLHDTDDETSSTLEEKKN